MSAASLIPYANESDVLQIGGLTIENRVDRITISGDIDLTLDQAGLADAKLLQKLLNDVVAQLERRKDLPAALPAPVTTTVANPFE